MFFVINSAKMNVLILRLGLRLSNSILTLAKNIKKMHQIIIGRKDRADLPDFGLNRIQVKIDTGAYSCSVDCRSAQLVEKDGVQQLEVIFLSDERNEFSGEKYYFTDFISKKVTSSTGNSQIRYFISGRIVLFGKEFTKIGRAHV